MTKFVKGNEAVVMGALYAGCEMYFGYPITPASEIAHGAAKWFPMLGRTFVQAECETASVNMMFGAAAAGRLCMTATSGPGFSLMQEGLSYLAGAELPAVVVDVNRAGPGLGPTTTAGPCASPIGIVTKTGPRPDIIVDGKLTRGRPQPWPSWPPRPP